MTNELNKSIATQIIGLQIIYRQNGRLFRLVRSAGQTSPKWRWHDTEAAAWSHCPAYDSDICAAWQVVEKLKDDGWMCVIAVLSKNYSVEFTQDLCFDAREESLPRAICLAALKAVNN